MGLLSLQGFLGAATFTVSTNADSGAGSLRTAITSANGTPGSTINFSIASGATITLASPLPAITANVTITGGSQIISGASSYPIFYVAPSVTATISSLTLSNGKAVGGAGGAGASSGGGGGLGAGGAIFVSSSSTVSTTSITYSSNNATGGAGGSSSSTAASGGGGGGGLYKAGGSATSTGGGGGGGLTTAGGNSTTATGGAASDDGGAGGNSGSAGTGGSSYGGGGGGGNAANGGAGGYGGGGGGSGGGSVTGGAGGFGAGGGGSLNGTAGTSTFGGGAGATGGGGGAGMGGAMFIQNTGSLTIQDPAISGSSVTAGAAGTGATAGGTYGTDIFLQSGGSLTINYTTGTLTLANPIISDVNAGGGSGGGLTINGNSATGTVSLSGTNSYTGGTTITAGTMSLAAAAVLPSAQNISVASGANLTLTGNSTTQSIGNLTGSGTVKLGTGSFTFNSGSGSSSTGIIFTGTGINLHKAGTGSWTTTAAAFTSSVTGNLNVDAGTFALTGIVASGLTNVACTLAASSTLDFSGLAVNPIILSLNGSSSTSIVKAGGNLITLGSNTSTTLTMSYAGDITSSSSSGGLRMNNPGSLTLTKALTFNASTNGAISVTRGTLIMSGAASVPSATSITLNSQTDSTTTPTFDISGITAGSFSIGNLVATITGGFPVSVMAMGTKNLTVNPTSTTSTYNGLFTGSGTLTKSGANNLVLGGSSGTGFTGNINLSAGTLSLAANTALGTGGTLSISDATSLVASATITLANPISLTGGATGIKFNIQPTFTATFSGAITGSMGAGTLQLNNSGTLILSNTGNTYTGTTEVNNGVLQAGAANTLPSASTIQVDSSANTPTLNLAGFNNTILALSGGGSSGFVTLGAGTLTLTSTSTFAGIISGTTGGLAITGGTATFSGASTYSGGTALSGGGLVAAVSSVGSTSGAFGTGTITTSNTTSITVNSGITAANAISLGGTTTLAVGSGTGTLSGNISGNGFSFGSSGTILILSGTNSINGTISISAGTLRAGSTSAFGSSAAISLTNTASTTLDLNTNSNTIASLAGGGSTGGNVTLGAGGVLTLAGSANTSYAGVISQAGSLVKSGSGNQTLSGASTYSAGTTLSGGTLTLGASTTGSVTSGPIGTGSISVATATLSLTSGVTVANSVSLGSSATLAVVSGTGTLSGNISGSGFTFASSGATLILSGNNSYSGTVNINAGTLQAGATTAFTTGSAVVLANTSGATLALNNFSNTIASLSGGGASGGNVTLGTGTLTFGDSNNLSYAGVISGAGTLTKQGSGNQTLSGASTYSVGTNLTAGTLTLAVSSVPATSGAAGTGAITMTGTSTLALNSGISAANNLTINGTNNISVASGTGTLTGNITSTVGFTLVGGGTLKLSGTNSYSGATNINAGTLQAGATTGFSPNSAIVQAASVVTGLDLNGFNNTVLSIAGGASGGTITLGSNTLVFGDGTSPTYSGVISGTNGSITKQGSGNTTLAGTNSYSGNTNLNAGALTASTSSAFGTSTVIMAGSTTLFFSGFTLSNTFTLNGTASIDVAASGTLSGPIGGGGILQKVDSGILSLSGNNSYSGGTNLNAGQITILSSTALGNVAGNVAMSTATVLSFGGTYSIGNAISMAGTATLDVQTSFTGTLTGVVSGTNLTKTGSGILVLQGANTYTSATNLNAGQITLTNATALGNNTGTVTMADTTILSFGGSYTVQNPIALTSGTPTIDVQTGFTGTQTGVISGASANLAKTGPGILILQGSNTYGGNTTLSAGQITLANASGLGNGSGILSLANSTTFSFAGSYSIANPVAIAASGTGTIDVQPTFTATLIGIVSGTSANLTKTGSGILILQGTNTYGGVTNLNVGQITIGNASALSSGTVNMATSTILSFGGTYSINNPIAITGTATLDVQPTFTGTSTGVISGTNLTKTGTGILVLQGTNTYTGNTNLNAGQITIANSSALGNGSGTVTMANNTTLSFGGTYSISNPISMSTTGILDVQAGFTGTLTGIVSGTNLTKTSTGTLVLQGTNTYTGNTNLNAGQITIANSSALGNGTGTVLMGNNTILSFGGTYSISNQVSMSTTGILDVQGAFTGTLTGVVSGTNLTKTSSGTLVLQGTNTYTGNTNLNAGQITIMNSSALGNGTGTVNMATSTILSFGGTYSISNPIAITGTAALDVQGAFTGTSTGVISGTNLTKTGTGILVLQGTNTYTGNTNLNAGQITLANSSALGNGSGTVNMADTTILSFAGSYSITNPIAITGTGTIDVQGAFIATLSGVISGTNLTKTSSGTLVLQGTNTYTGNTNLNAGQITIANSSALGNGSGTVNMATSTILSFGGTYSISNPIAITGTATLDVQPTFTGTSTGVISGTNLTKTGTGILVLQGTNTYTGNTNLNAGQITIANSSALGNGSGTVTMANNTTLSFAGNYSISNPVSMSTTGILDVQAGFTGTLTGVVSGTNLTKTSTGTLVLQGTNTYTGNTNLNAGQITIANSSALGNGTGTVVMGNNTILSFGGTYSISNPVSMSTTGILDVQGAFTGTLTGVVSGTNLTKTSSGTLVLQGTNTYTGNTNLNAGQITIMNSSALGNGTGTVNMATSTILSFGGTYSISNPIAITGTATLDVQGAFTGTSTGVISGTNLTKTGSGILILQGTNTYTGNTNLNAGQITLANASALGNGSGTVNMADTTILSFAGAYSISNPIAITGTGTIDVQGAFIATLTGVISGTNLTKTSSGTLILNQANTYTGNTNLTAGTIEIQNNNSLGSGAGTLAMSNATTLIIDSGISAINPVTLAGTSTINVASGSGTLSGIISGVGGGFSKTGNGNLILNGTNTFTGNTSLTAGTITVGNNAALGATSSTLSMSNGTTVAFAGSYTIGNNIAITGTGTFDVGGSITGTITGIISGGALTKTSSGILALQGANSYTGNTNLNAGQITILNSSALGSGSSTVNMADTTILSFGGTYSISNPISMAGTATLDVQGAFTGTLTGVVSGTNLTKTSSGTLVLQGTNTYTGNTNLNAGQITIGNSNALGNGAGTVNMATGTTLSFAGNYSITNPVAITGTATVDVQTGFTGTLSGIISGLNLVKTSSGILVLSGSNTYSGTTSLNAGQITIANSSALGNGTGIVSMANSTILSFAGNYSISNPIAITGTATLDVQGAFTGTSTGVISGTNLTKTGSGILVLQGTNTYSGNTNLNAGQITIANSSALGNGSGTVNMATSTILSFGGTYSVSNPIAITGTATLDVQPTFTGTSTGVISGTNLTKTGTGILVLQGTNTYTGNTNLNAGQITIANSSALGNGSGTVTMANNTTLSFAGNYSISNPVSMSTTGILDVQAGFTGTLTGVVSGTNLTKTSTGTLVLQGTNTYTGNTNLNAGQITIANSSALGNGTGTVVMGNNTILSFGGTYSISNPVSMSTTGILDVQGAFVGTLTGVVSGTNLTKTSSGTLVLQGTNTYTGNTNLNAGQITIMNSSALGNGTGTVNMATSTILSFGGTYSISNPIAITGTATLDVQGAFTGTSTGVISGTNLTKTGTGILVLQGTNTYTGNTNLNAGQITIANASALGNGSGTVNMADTTILSFAGAYSISNPIAITGTGTIDVQGAFIGTVTGGISGNILTKTGSGTLVLAVANSYSGGTNLTAGTIEIQNNNSLGSGAGTLAMSNATTLIIDSGVSAINPVTLAGTSTINVAVGTGTLSGIISGSGGGFNKTGNGDLTLNGNNSYTGNTNLQAGVITVGNNSALGASTSTLFMSNLTTVAFAGNYTIVNNISITGIGVFDVGTSFNGNITGNISGGALTKTSPGALTLSGNNSYTGNTNLDAGEIIINSATALGTSAGTLFMADSTILSFANSYSISNDVAMAGTATLDVPLGLTGTLSGIVSGLNLTKTSGGTLVLSGANTYTGNTNITAGQVTVANNTALGNGAGTVNMSNGTILGFAGSYAITNPVAITGTGSVDVSASYTATLNGVVSGGVLQKTDSGALVLAVANSYSGGTLLVGGTIEIQNNSSLGAGLLSMSAATTLAIDSAISAANAISLLGNATINVAAGTGTLSGVISGSGFGFTKAGGGTLVLSNSNTYSGNTNLNTGQITAATNTALGVGGSLAMSGGTTLALDDTVTLANAISIAGTSTIDVSSGGGGLSGQITGIGLLSKTGGGTLTLSNNSTSYLGGTNLTAGTLALTQNNAMGSGLLTMSSATTLSLTSGLAIINNINLAGAAAIDLASGASTLSGQISGGLADLLTKTGSGNLTLSGNSSYSGGTALTAGAITLASNSGLGTGTLAMSNATTLVLSTSISAANHINFAGADVIDVASSTSTLSGLLDGTGSFTKTGNGVLSITNTNSYLGGTTIQGGTVSAGANGALGSGSVSIQNLTTLDLANSASLSNLVSLTGTSIVNVSAGNGTLSGVISGNGSLNKTGSATLTLNANNSYLGGTNLLTGTLAPRQNGALGSGTLAMSGATTLSLVNALAIGNAITLTGASAIDVASGTAILSGGLGDGTGSGGFTKTSNGTLQLQGASSYSGQTNIQDGSLQAGGTNVFSPNSIVNLSNDATALLDLNNFNNTIPALSGGGDVGGKVNLTSATLLTGSGASSTYSGEIYGNGSLSKQGGSSLTLNGQNSYTGGTTIIGGTLVLASSDTLSSVSSMTIGAATLDISPGGDQEIGTLSSATGLAVILLGNNELAVNEAVNSSYAGAITGAGNFTKLNVATLTLTGTGLNTYSGQTFIADGSLDAGATGVFSPNSQVVMGNAAAALLDVGSFDNTIGGLTGSSGAGGSVSLNGATLTIMSSVDETYPGVIHGNGTIIKAGNTIFTLSGANTFTGDTDVAAGTLNLTGSVASDVNVGSGATLAGTGFIGGNLVSNGTIAPGPIPTGVGILTVAGNMDILAGSLFACDITPTTNDELIAGGAVTIGSGTTFIVNPAAGIYSSDKIYTVIHGGSVSGTFSSVTIPALLDATLFYAPTEVLLLVQFHGLASLVSTGNAGAVASALDTLLAQGDSAASSILDGLFFLSADELYFALNQMHPAELKGMMMTQQEAALDVRNSLSSHIREELNTLSYACLTGNSCPLPEQFGFDIWGSGFGGLLSQVSTTIAAGPEIGYKDTLSGAIGGVDMRFAQSVTLGAFGAKTFANINWNSEQGHGKVISEYLGASFAGAWKTLYGSVSFIEAINHYSASRVIRYPGILEVADSTHEGKELVGHVDLGMRFNHGGFTFRPFDSFDYLNHKETSFTERNAGFFNLAVDKFSSTLLRNQLGAAMNFAGCSKHLLWNLEVECSWVREIRRGGSTYTSQFAGTDVPFVVIGFTPSRSLVAPGATFSGRLFNGRLTFSASYQGQFGGGYKNQEFGGSVKVSF